MRCPHPAASVLSLTGALSVLTATAFGQAPNLLGSQLLPGSPILGPATGAQKAPAIALGSTSSLLVFTDDRAGDTDLFGVRLDATGAPIDAVPFPITKGPGTQTAPRVAWNGQNWLVVYTNQVDPGSGYFAYEFAALRVSPQGQVLDAAPIPLAQDGTGGSLGVASDGTNWVVLYTGTSAGNNDVRAQRISPGGAVLDPTGVVVFLGAWYSVFDLGATFAQGEYLFTWTDPGIGLRGRRFTTLLQPIDAAPVLLPVGPIGNGLTASVAGNGGEFFIAWTHENVYFTTEIVGTRLDPDLNVLGSPMIPISGSSPSVYHLDPHAVWDGTQWIPGWLTAGTQEARAARVSASGAVLDPGGVALPDASPNYLYDPAIGALPSGGALLAWDDIRFGGSSLYDVFGTSFSAAGAAGVERCYSVGSEALRSPRVTAGQDQALVTYRAELASASRVLAQRVDAFGNAFDAEPIEVASANHPGLTSCGAAWNGSTYLVTWSDASQGKVFARRMLPDGTFLDGTPIFVLLGGDADAAALGPDFLVTGLRAPSYPQYVFSYGARVRGSDGAVLDNPALLIGPSYATRARVATLGGQWVVATERHWTHNDNTADLALNFVSAAGGVAPSINAGTLNVQNWGSLDIASSGSSALVVGQSGSNWTNADVYARRILPGGSMPAPLFNLTGSAGLGQSRATAGWTGSEYVVAYETFQNNAWFYDYEPDIYAARVSETGTLIDTTGFGVWIGEDYEVGAEGGGLGNGRAMFAASTYVDGAYGSFRIGLRGMRPAGLANYGTGTPGCAGPERADANSEPSGGNANFALSCDRAPAGAAGLAALSTTPDVAGSDPLGLGVLVHVGVLPPSVSLLLPISASGEGLASLALPVPADPALYGGTVYFQAAFGWSGTCAPSPFGLSTSDGLAITIQAP